MQVLQQRAQALDAVELRAHSRVLPGQVRTVAPRSGAAWQLRMVLLALALFALSNMWGVDISLFVIVIGLFVVIAKTYNPSRFGQRVPLRRRASDGRGCLSPLDIDRLAASVEDPLQGKYLDLVQTALLLAPPSEAAVAQTVRAAIHALGTAIEGLPRHTSPLLTDNPGVLHAEADRLATQARTEPDAVIAASLERRADSYAHRAETVVRAQTLLRRNEALRDEMADQTDALRTSLIASGITQEIEGAGLGDLAANVQRIATEVNALSAARAEVEDALHGAPQRAADQATRVRLRKYLDEIHTVVDKNVTHPGG